jgi:bifunctional non-homologous end joining protein LigD
MTLETYRRKRRFGRTPEPPGDAAEPRSDGATATSGRFVVQRHRATRLHYDFRLEIDGVLASWAVPRGPSLDPGQRRLAIHVEDHPLGYYSFEGVIPRGEYGGGDVIVWDWGRWTADESITDALTAIRNGELKFRLEGRKLRGSFVLVRTAWREGRKEQWLLIHRRDDDAVPGWDAEDYPESVKTGRTNDEVAARRRARTSSRSGDGIDAKRRDGGPRSA